MPTKPKKVVAKVQTRRLSDGTLLRVYFYGKPKGKRVPKGKAK